MLSLCKPEQFYQVFLAQGLGVGIGAGAVYVPSIAIVSHYFQKRRALAMSIVTAGSALGAVVHPIMLNNTLRSSLGFANALDAVTHGISQTFSFYSLVIMNASSFVGRLSPGFFARRFGILNMVSIASGCGSVLILCMIALNTVASVVLLGVLYGFCAGVFVTLMGPLLAVLTEDMGELGLRMGVSFAMVGIGGLIGPPINGALLTGDFLWWRPALFSGVMAFTGFFVFLATLVVVRRKKAMKKDTPSPELEKLEGERAA
ncbi:major facilitator superfamily domain-containing protein [Mycena rosella]|uniref:Major facilitator superfamily domain-containing protein n=1 Tax=Mycena rosella TaxID=1033263 RepID=A0AAD7GDU2_MYCRO|nr:major facilitator superfamily domain-containing protein [Mycena rosella]